MAHQTAPLVALVGPTGAGKSRLAIAIAERFRGEIVNFDSVQLYRGLDIGSAKISPSERNGIPHHLLDVLDLRDEMTAGAYARLARRVLDEITGRGSLPILVGGTGFYLRALLDGLSPAPLRNPALRHRLSDIAQRRPLALHRFLRRSDPLAAARIHPNDLQKLIRAIELTLLARRPATVTQSIPRDALSGYTVMKIGLAPDRTQLYNRLDLRSARMFESGLLEETKALLDSGLSPSAKPLLSLGYKQAVAVLTGAMSIPQAIAECRTKTRQYAKRQLTWFRSEPHTEWLHGFGSDPSIQAQAIALVKEFLVPSNQAEGAH